MQIPAEQMAGMWDVYSNGMHSEINLIPNGTYVHMLWGGVQGHWGHWTVQDGPDGEFLQLELQGAEPPMLGPGQMQWPAVERWLFVNIMGSQIQTTDSMMIRRVMMAVPPPGMMAPNAFGAPQGFASPQGFAPAKMPGFPAFAGPPQMPFAPPFQPQMQGGMGPGPQGPPQGSPQGPMPAPMPMPAPTVPSFSAINTQWQQLHDQQMATMKQLNKQKVDAMHQGAQDFINGYINT